MKRLCLLAFISCATSPWLFAQAAEPPSVTAPPESFFEIVREPDREAARRFYKKHLAIQGLPVVAADEVDHRALWRTREIVSGMLAGRPDILKELVKDRMYLIIIGKDQVYTDMPEYRNHPNPEFQNERVRGTGGRPTSFGEENLLNLPIDRYDDESIAVHEFSHTIDNALRSIDPTWSARRNAVFQNARRKDLYSGTYAGSNPGEYWAEICQSFFDCNRVNNWNHGPCGTREQLKVYDPEGYALVRDTFRLRADQDWRYTWLQKLPNVIAPPARFQIDPYYTKFTWARELPVVGRNAGDEALLKANDTVRKMFAYRHDILKALIADGVKLAVVGREERVSNLPEFQGFEATPRHEADEPSRIDLLSRAIPYNPTKLLVVGEEHVLENQTGDCQVIRLFADAIYYVTGTRPVDESFDRRPARLWQQYELKVRRMDVRFDEALTKSFDEAMTAGKWRGTAAVHNRVAYWCSGVLAYFDAAGDTPPPPDALVPIKTRESLRDYDPSLYALVHETMAFGGKVDWRYAP